MQGLSFQSTIIISLCEFSMHILTNNLPQSPLILSTLKIFIHKHPQQPLPHDITLNLITKNSSTPRILNLSLVYKLCAFEICSLLLHVHLFFGLIKTSALSSLVPWSPVFSRRTLCSDGNITMSVLANMVITSHCSHWAFDMQLVWLRNGVFNLI